MRAIRTPARTLFLVFAYLILTLVGIICLAPMWHTLCASFSSPQALAANKGLLFLPEGGFTLKGYEIVFQNMSIWKSYLNTLIYVVGGTALGITMTSLGAYTLSRKYFLPAGTLMLLISFTMLFNGGRIPNSTFLHERGVFARRVAL